MLHHALISLPFLSRKTQGEPMKNYFAIGHGDDTGE